MIVRWALLVIWLAAAPAFAEAPPEQVQGRDAGEIETIVITASATPRPLGQIPGTVDVITRAEIEAMSALEVADALRNLAGLHLDQPGGRGGRASLYLRGLDPNQTIVMLDGIRLNDPNNNRGGSFDLTTLDVESIERIEVVRGPLSAVHGSDAMAGAVNIITRGGRGPDAASLDVSGGRYGQYRTVATLRGQRGPIDLALSGGYTDSGRPESESQYEGGHVGISLGVELPHEADLRATFRYLDADLQAFPDDSGGTEFAVLRALEIRDIEEITVGLRLEQAPLDWLGYALTTSYYQRAEDRSSPGVAPGIRDPFGLPAEVTRDKLKRYEFRARGTADLGAGVSLALGGDVYHEMGESESVLDFGGFMLPASFERQRTVGGPFGELHFESRFGLVAEAGLRVDFTDEPGTDAQVMPRVGGSYQLPWVPIKLHGSWGKGFKLPSFYALGNPLVGDPTLKPERSEGFDVGARLSGWEEKFEANLTYFETKVKDQIDFEEGPPPRLVNRDRVVSWGVEFEVAVYPDDSIDLLGSVSYTHADIVGVDEELRNRPRWRGSLAARWRPCDTLQLGLTALFVGSLLDSSVPTGDQTLESYTRVDFASSWDFSEQVSLVFAIDNLFNENYQEAVGFPAPGTNPRLGLRVRY